MTNVFSFPTGDDAAYEEPHAASATASDTASDVASDAAPCAYSIAVIVGSPRRRGVSNQLTQQLVEALGEKDPSLNFAIWRTSDHQVAPCDGCGACRQTYRCRHRDDMDGLIELLDATDRLFVVSPVYFAGPPSQFKAVLDRLQPYWERRCGPAMREEFRKPIRSAFVVAVGDGGDPHGFQPLVGCVRSALGASGFSLEGFFGSTGWDPSDGLDPEFIDAVHQQIRQGLE